MNELMTGKKSRRKHYLLIVAFIIPIILTALILYLIFGDFVAAFLKMWNLRGHPNKTADAMASLSYIGTILIAYYGLLTTALFSYLVWRVSLGSFQISNDLKKLEENRDKEIYREQALIVYYDLQRGFAYLRDLYISNVLKSEHPNPKKLFFSNDWIKNVASLRNELSNEDLSIVYQIYNDFFTIQSLLENFQEESSEDINELSKVINNVRELYFADFIPMQVLNEFSSPTAEDIIDINYFIVLQKIYSLTFSNIHLKKIKTGINTFDILIDGVLYYTGRNGDVLNGEGTIYNKNGYEKAKGHFVDGKFVTGQVYGYFDSVNKRYAITYRTTGSERKIAYKEIIDLNNTGEIGYFYKGDVDNGEIKNGIITKFHSNGSIAFRGNIVNGEREGSGTSYDIDGKISFKGEYKSNLRFRGTLYKNGKKSFEGNFQDGRPWNGQVFNYVFNNEKVRKFTGEILNGKPYSGSGYRYKRNEHGEDLDYIIYQENWEPDESVIEQQEIDFQDYINKKTREEYNHWEDYIKTDWLDGNTAEREDIEENIIVYYNERDRKN
ncbi:hypothetical protein GMB86_08520 [Terrilactibacillus sp. BCM23-1]|uniref:MORN repeat-containing protein n=1 Tax=Terrilactibacillus tamarindi TaxID=2599694 RepID=A0A6N8CSL7_9BACI|nr:hypothetical protein [Terrilactibacillus tamarindi]MTT32053.1 hypothetical protein [Terrilactibacillus tamarindi]